MTDSRAQSLSVFMLMALGIIVTMIIAIVMVRLSLRAELPFDTAKANPVAPPEFGVVGIIVENGVEREFRAPTLNLRIEPGVAGAYEWPRGPFEAEFTVTFDRGRVQYAQIGAELEGGSLIVMRGEEVLVSDYAPSNAAKLVLTRVPQHLGRRREQIRFIFRSDGEGQVTLRAVWQPENADQPQPLPSPGT